MITIGSPTICEINSKICFLACLLSVCMYACYEAYMVEHKPKVLTISIMHAC